MTSIQKERISKALTAYTKKITASSEAAKKALENEGIFQPDGKLTAQYRDVAAA